MHFKTTLPLTLLFLLSFIPFHLEAETLTDRQQISQTMKSFYQWDHTGGIDNANKSFAASVLYNRIGEQGNHITYTPNFDYKGAGENAYLPIIVDMDIYGKMALVRSVHHYEGKGRYLKAFVLHKLQQGWRITNVSWGKLTPHE
jgi:hypothetical protein